MKMIKTKIKKVLKYMFLIIASILAVFPFFWMIVSATNKSVDITKGKLTPGSELINNINTLFISTYMLRGMINSLIISTITTCIALFISSVAGYGFEIFHSRRRGNLFNLLLLSMMIPFAALMVPLYRMFAKFGLLNNYLAVIIPSVATAFLIFFFRQNTKSFPKEILHAARVDGLSEFGIFIKIYIPTMKSTYAAAAIITFMNVWNSYLWPLIVLQSPEKMTLPLIISTLNSSYYPDFGMIMVAIVIATIPTALIFFLMQKRFVEGMLGSVK